MIDIEYVSQISMDVITNSGMAKSCYMEALQQFKQNHNEEGENLLKEGDSYQINAHKAHAEILAKEMSDMESQATMLLIHAEDQLMSAETIKILVEELSEVY